MDGNPYISFVVVARNDNYGGDFLYRINVFVKNIIMLCEKYKLDSELIIVEWNPPVERPRLKDTISWPDIKRQCCQIRIIEVPNEIHQNISNPAKLRLFEYVGKNVGIQRAKGEYILATNPDEIFSKELIKFLAQKKLLPKCFYRIDRYDVKSPVPLALSVEKQLEYCEKNVVKVHSYYYSYEKFNLYRGLRALAGHFKQSILHFSFARPHTNAAGDFFLMYRKHWNTIRGYPELETKGKSHHIDGLPLYMAQFCGLMQRILKSPLRLYHQDHNRPDSSAKPISQAVDLAYKQLMEKHKLIKFNDESWGLGNYSLPEEVF